MSLMIRIGFSCYLPRISWYFLILLHVVLMWFLVVSPAQFPEIKSGAVDSQGYGYFRHTQGA
jgi:hypothetical protein